MCNRIDFSYTMYITNYLVNLKKKHVKKICTFPNVLISLLILSKNLSTLTWNSPTMIKLLYLPMDITEPPQIHKSDILLNSRIIDMILFLIISGLTGLKLYDYTNIISTFTSKPKKQIQIRISTILSLFVTCTYMYMYI